MRSGALGQMMFTKTLIVVDHDVNVQDLSEVTWVVGNHIDPKRDTIFVDGGLSRAIRNDSMYFVQLRPCSGARRT